MEDDAPLRDAFGTGGADIVLREGFEHAVFVEYVFDWKGMGIVIVDGLDKYDFPVVMGAILFICVLLIVINILTDILYGLLDPRVRIN